MKVGDIVNYKEFVAVVTTVAPLRLALHDGTTVSVSENEVTLLMNRSFVLEIFETKLGGGAL